VIVAGRGLLGPGARERVAAFADATGALLATTLPLRGWFHGDPYDLGLAGGYARPLARELIADADCVLGLGASLNHYTLAAGALCPAATLIQVDLRGQHRTGTGRRADAYVRGDALSTVDALTALVPPRTRYRTPAVAERIAAQRDVFDPEEFAIQPGTVDPRAVLDALDDALPDRHRVVLGGGHQRDLASMHLARWRGEQIQTTGAIGQGLALGVGVALALGDPVAVIEGDGGVLMNVQELNTLVRYDVPVLLFVMNNGALGSELYKLPVHGFPAALATIPDTDFAAVARAFGCRATTVTDPAQVADVVSGFLAAPGPYVVDVRVSPAVVGIPYRSRLGKAVR
jgi:thiamine pyrophosphate-dependent acetolactate synthase large subunit-like protein